MISIIKLMEQWGSHVSNISRGSSAPQNPYPPSPGTSSRPVSFPLRGPNDSMTKALEAMKQKQFQKKKKKSK